jgi:FkbM family methyltransferase
MVRGVGRRAYWSIASRLPESYHPYPFPGGKIYLNIADSPAMVKRVLRLYEREKRIALSTVLEPAMTFIDVGANIGDFSLIAARLVGATGRVLAFEPDPANCRLIKMSVAANHYPNVEIHELALSDRDGQAILHLGDRHAWNSLIPGLRQREAGELVVNTRALDALLDERGNPPVHAMKIDVEGAELSVLRGAVNTLARNEGLVLFLDVHPHLGVQLDDVESFLRHLGFRFYSMSDPGSELPGIPQARRDVLVRRA